MKKSMISPANKCSPRTRAGIVTIAAQPWSGDHAIKAGANEQTNSTHCFAGRWLRRAMKTSSRYRTSSLGRAPPLLNCELDVTSSSSLQIQVFCKCLLANEKVQPHRNNQSVAAVTTVHQHVPHRNPLSIRPAAKRWLPALAVSS